MQVNTPQTIPAKSFDKMPRFNFAVFSVRLGSDVAELESSFDSLGYAQGLFERQYSSWGFTDTNFYLVDWKTQTIITAHVVWQGAK